VSKAFIKKCFSICMGSVMRVVDSRDLESLCNILFTACVKSGLMCYGSYVYVFGNIDELIKKFGGIQ